MMIIKTTFSIHPLSTFKKGGAKHLLPLSTFIHL